MVQAVQHLSSCTSPGELKREIRKLCARFGRILRIDVLTAKRAGKFQAMCFWRMESPELEDDVMSEFGVGRFAGDLVMIVNLDGKPRNHAENAPLPASDERHQL